LKKSITIKEEGCDACGLKFNNAQIKDQDSCPSKKNTMGCSVGLPPSNYFGPCYFLELGDLCVKCHKKLFDTVKAVFPHAKLIKTDD